jgi:hypothetical protein
MVYAPIGGGSLAGRVRLGARRMRLGWGRGTRLAFATLLATLAAAFAFAAPAGAQESPGAPPADTSTSPADPEPDAAPATGGADATTSGGSTDGAEPPSEPSTPEPGAETSEPPASSPEAPADDTAGGAESTPEESGSAPSDTAPAPDTCAPPSADADAAPEPAGDCAPTPDPACDTDAPAGADGEATPGCQEAVEPDPAPAPAPATPPAAPPPAPVTPQFTGPVTADTVIFVFVSEPVTAPPAPQQPELANRLLPHSSRASTLPEAVELASAEAEPSAPATDVAGLDEVLDPDLSKWFESVAPTKRRLGGSCAVSTADMALPGSCAGNDRESIMIASAPRPWPEIGTTTIPPGAARAAAFQRQRRIQPEARSDPERAPVAVAPVASPRDHGRRVSGGSSGGGSSASASLRVFALSSLPLSLAAPVSFPAEPLPTLLPDGELGVPPPASPG